ncbi:hypothetical protein [Gordonia alkanivorans]|uniref:hypothetical protein n=1 Tax=Gordonia alkanivorans TaxID=84096 RepID=UPI0005A7C0BE|nr:hypothetical protein [Gordonia alkanivorans]
MSISVEVGRTPRGQRSYPLGFKVEFLQLWDAAMVERGGRARLMREYGLSRATVRGWLEARVRGDFEASMVSAALKSKGSSRVDAQERAELARLRAENRRLKKKVEQAEAIQQIMGKAIELMDGITASSTDEEESIPPALMSAEQYQQWLNRKGLS